MQINQGLKEYNKKVRQGKIKRAKKLNPIEKSRQNPKSLRLAINARCYDCAGFEKKEVVNCEMTDCELYNLRPWQKPYIKTQMNGVGALLLEKSVIKKYSLSESKTPQHKLNSKVKLLPPYARLQANPKSLRAAINAYCFWCCCEQYIKVKLCPGGNCPLHHLRPWQPKKIGYKINKERNYE